MSYMTRFGAVAMALVLVLSMATPALASEPAGIDVDIGTSSYTVTVTHNGSAVNDTEVTVTPTDPNATYAGANGFTDVNGTVTFNLPANQTEVNISTTHNGTETTVTETLPGASAEPSWDGEGPFGQWVQTWLHDLLNGEDTTGPVGQTIADLVRQNNPGSDHRSDNANPGGNGNGPPDHAGNNDNGGGPPDHAKNDDEDNDE